MGNISPKNILVKKHIVSFMSERVILFSVHLFNRYCTPY